MIERIKEWDITIKCVVWLFLLRNMILHPVIRNEAEEYLESHRILLSDWKDEIDGPWYKEVTYFDNSYDYENAYLGSDRWEVIQYNSFKNLFYDVRSTGVDLILNPTARIREVGDSSPGRVFFITKLVGVTIPYICILPENSDQRNYVLHRIQTRALQGNRKDVIKLINMYCDVYPMLAFDDTGKSNLYTFGRQIYITGVINDGLYIDLHKEREVRHVQKTV
jgi:hypothetical protein